MCFPKISEEGRSRGLMIWEAITLPLVPCLWEQAPDLTPSPPRPFRFVNLSKTHLEG